MSAITTLVAQNNDLAMFFIRQLSIDLGISDERTVNLTQKHIRDQQAHAHQQRQRAKDVFRFLLRGILSLERHG